MAQPVTISVELTFEVEDPIGLMADTMVVSSDPSTGAMSNALGTPERALGMRVDSALRQAFPAGSAVALVATTQSGV